MVKVESNGKKTFASGPPVRRSLGPLGPAHVGLPRALICNLSSYLLHFLPLLQSLLLLLIPSPPTPVSSSSPLDSTPPALEAADGRGVECNYF